MSTDCNNGIKMPIDSLIRYIRDIKPYHTKFLEIVEKYNFSEDMYVDIQEKLFTAIKIINDPLCKPTGFGLEWDEECGFDPLNCCDLFECIGGYGLIFDNSDILVSLLINSIDTTLGTITVAGDHRADTKFAIESIPSNNEIVVLGDQTSLFNTHKLFLVVPQKTYNILETTATTVTIEGEHSEQFGLNPEFSITSDRYNTGTYSVVSTSLSSGNTIITVSGGGLTPSVSDLGVVESDYVCKNQGPYQVLSSNFDGINTTVTLIASQTFDFTDTTESGKHGSIQLRTGLVSPRRIYLQGNSANNDRDYKISSTSYNSATDETTLTLVGTLTDNSTSGTVDLIGYNFGAGFDGYEECSVPKPSNIHSSFSEFLDIVVSIVLPTPTPSATVTPTPTPTVTITPTISVTPSVSDTPKPTPTSTPTVTVSVTPSPTISVTPSISITPTPTISVTPTVTPSITPSSTPAGEQGFDLGLGTPGAHTYVGGDTSHVENISGSTLTATVLHSQTQPHTDTSLRYFECIMTNLGSHSFQGNIGYGIDAPGTFVGNHADSAGYLVGVKSVRQGGTTLHTTSTVVDDGEIAFCYVRGQRLWFGSYTSGGLEIIGGGDPELDTSPTVILTQTGNLRPLVTCLYDDSDIQINTVGGFSNPSIAPSAIPWGSV